MEIIQLIPVIREQIKNKWMNKQTNKHNWWSQSKLPIPNENNCCFWSFASAEASVANGDDAKKTNIMCLNTIMQALFFCTLANRDITYSHEKDLPQYHNSFFISWLTLLSLPALSTTNIGPEVPP